MSETPQRLKDRHMILAEDGFRAIPAQAGRTSPLILPRLANTGHHRAGGENS